jgi:hypothetical protein
MAVNFYDKNYKVAGWIALQKVKCQMLADKETISVLL